MKLSKFNQCNSRVRSLVIRSISTQCPGRISLSKHADYINSDLLYLLDNRSLHIDASLITEKDHKFFGSLVLENADKNFASVKFSYSELQNKNFDKAHWSFYILKLIEELDLIDKFKDHGLVMVIDSQIPVGSGLSSSHALILASFMALVELFELKDFQKILASRTSPNMDKQGLLQIIRLCQKIENAKGFNSGLGDQSVQLLGKKNHFTFIKILPELQVEYREIPDDLAIISAPSFIKAEKSLPEFKAANENIALYKKINELVKNLGSNYLADMIYSHSEKEIFDFLLSIDDCKIRGLALYGLAEAKRINELKEKLDSTLLGKHLNLSHQAELNFHYDNESQSLTEFNPEEKLNYLLNPSLKLAEHCGVYRASTLANDELYYLAKQIPGVFGSSISGAGLGGNNTILCDKNQVEQVKTRLLEGFYKPKGLANPFSN